MALCQAKGRSDMYGLGIRIAVYSQWFGAVIMSHVAEDYLPNIRVLGLLLSAAMTLAFIIQVANDNLNALDMYITLLLMSGIYIPLIPFYILRVLTLCHPSCNPLRWSEEKAAPAVGFGNFLLLVVVSSLGVWTWTTSMPGVKRDCVQYGFFFSKVSLTNKGFIALHSMIYVGMVVVCVCVIFLLLGCRLNNWRRAKRRLRRARYFPPLILLILCGLSNLTVVSVLVTAVELTIRWNDLNSVNDVDTVAQTIPIFLSLVAVVSVVVYSYRVFKRDANEDESERERRPRVRVRVAPVSSSSSKSSSSPSSPSSSSGSHELGRAKRYTSSGHLVTDDESVSTPSRAYTA